jgi:hypothetical protein
MIIGSFFDPATMHNAKKAMGVTKKADYVSQGYKPTGQNPAGVLLELKSSPIAYYNYPTLNQMVFRDKLWQKLLQDPELTTRMRKASALWGENGHQDSLEIKIPLISNKVTDFWLSEDKNNLVMGNVQILDTPQGNIVYSLIKSGDMGISSRGWGDLVPINSGAYSEFANSDFYSKPEMKVVSEDGYIATSWDFVTVPAVGPAMLSIRQHLDRFTDAKKAVRSSLSQYPVNPDLAHLKQMLEPEVRKKVFTFSGPTPAQTPPRDGDFGGESNDDNGEVFDFGRNRSFSPRNGNTKNLEMGKKGWDPKTVAEMSTRRYRDVSLPHRPEGDPGVREPVDEKKPPKQNENPKTRLLMQSKDDTRMTMERLPEDKQRALFDKLVAVELSRSIELRDNSRQSGF